jgi:hypothetical protein
LRATGASLPIEKRFVIGSSAAVHRSVGMLFARRRKFGGRISGGFAFVSHVNAKI